MNKLLIIFLGSFAYEILMYAQHDYKIILEHIELDGTNKIYIEDLYVKNVKPNRTYKALEARFRTKKDLSGDQFKVHVELLQFLHNEYRRTSIVFDVKICEILDKNIFGMNVLLSRSGNLTKCPLRRGTYLIHDFNVDYTTFPPHLPRGRYQAKVRFLLEDVDLGGISWFASVEDIVKY